MYLATCAAAHRGPSAFAAPLHEVEVEPASGLILERAWRRLGSLAAGSSSDDIIVSRWIDPCNERRTVEAQSLPDRYVVSLALKAVRVKFTRGPRTVFEGVMPAGALHVTGPAEWTKAEFGGPCDFIHFHARSARLRRPAGASSGALEPERDLADFTTRDPLAAQLGRSLVEGSDRDDPLYARNVGEILVTRLAGLRRPQSKINALPKWRLKRVQAYIDAHIDESLSLADMAMAAGLSRMHFAAQFRVATGYRPHDYLLFERIERAKSLLSEAEMSLAEVALNVGFQAQAHFSTVFKQLTGETPARWRRAVANERRPRETEATSAARPSRSWNDRVRIAGYHGA